MKCDYFLSVFVQHALAQSAPHFLSAFFVQASQAFPSLQAVHAAFSDFLAEQPQVSQANTDDPAMNNAIAAILIILFIRELLFMFINCDYIGRQPALFILK